MRRAGGRGGRRGGDRGFALVLVLWALALLSAVAAGEAGRRRALALDTRAAEAAALRAGAREAGLVLALAAIRAARAGGGAVPGFLSCRFGVARIDVAIEDEEGKVDLNHAGPPALAALFAALGAAAGEAERLSGAVIAFRSPGPAAPGLRRGRADVLGEYRAVPGLAALPGLARLATVYSGRGTLAGPAVPEALRAALAEAGLSELAEGPGARTTFRLRLRAVAEGGEALAEAVVRLPAAGPGRAQVLDWRTDAAEPPPAGPDPAPPCLPG